MRAAGANIGTCRSFLLRKTPPAMSSLRPAQGAPLAAWLAYLETLHPKAIDLGLDRVRAVA